MPRAIHGSSFLRLLVVFENIAIKVGLHLGWMLSPYLFDMIMNEAEVLWCILFINNILLIDRTREGVKTKLDV